MGDFFDTVKNLRHSGPGALACPVCGSIRIKQRGSLGGWLLPPDWACTDCGYVGKLVLELDREDSRKQKND